VVDGIKLSVALRCWRVVHETLQPPSVPEVLTLIKRFKDPKQAMDGIREDLTVGLIFILGLNPGAVLKAVAGKLDPEVKAPDKCLAMGLCRPEKAKGSGETQVVDMQRLETATLDKVLELARNT
jgi:hypothetical protein